MSQSGPESGEARNSNWLFKQSSELELLISAAIVFASIQVGDLVQQMIFSLLNNNVPGNSEWLVLLAVIGLFTSWLLPISIVAHFLLRFYWLSLVGLRSVFTKETDLSKFSKPFEKVLRRPTNLDTQIETIDRFSSSIFAFSFMTLFAFCLSVSSVIIIIFIIIPGISQFFDNPVVDTLLSIVGNLFLFLCLFYMVDFFTLGWFKRIKSKWFVRIYLPLYRFMSVVTFSFFYRGIYYSLVQHTSRAFLGILLPLYVFVTIFLLNASYSPNKLYERNIRRGNTQEQFIRSDRYLDQFAKTTIIRGAFIESYVVPGGQQHLKVHIPLTAELEDSLLVRCPDIIPLNAERSLNWRRYLQLGFNQRKFPDDFDAAVNNDIIFDCLRDNVKIAVNDSTIQIPSYRFYEISEPRKPVFLSVIDVADLGRGDHLLIVSVKHDSTEWRDQRIPFWKD